MGDKTEILHDSTITIESNPNPETSMKASLIHIIAEMGRFLTCIT